MPNNYLSVLYKHIIQVENKNGGGRGEGQTYHCPPIKKGGHMPPPPTPRWLEIKYMCCKTKHVKTFFTFVVCMYRPTMKFLLTTEIK